MKSALLLALAVTVAFLLGVGVKAEASFPHEHERVISSTQDCANCDDCEKSASGDITCKGHCQTACAAGSAPFWMASSEDTPWQEAVTAYERSRDDRVRGLCATKDPPPPRS